MCSGRLVVVRRCILQVGWEGSEQRQAGHNSSGQYQLHQHHRHQQLWPVLSNRGCQTGASAPGWDPSRGRGARPGGIALRRVQMCCAGEDARPEGRGPGACGWQVACGMRQREEWNGGLGLGLVPLVIHTYRTAAEQSSSRRRRRAGLGLGLVDSEGWWPSIRFVMAERTVCVCVCARGCGCG